MFLHPNLLDSVNNVLRENNQEIYDFNDLVDIFEDFLVKQMLEPSREQYIKSAVVSIARFYPELIPIIEKKLSILNKDKHQKISYILNNLEKQLSDFLPVFPKELIKKAKNIYE